MRLVCKITDKEKAKRFLAYMMQENCQGVLEEEEDQYSIWVYDEDQYQLALDLYEKFNHPEFKETIIKESIRKEEEISGPLPISNDPIFLAQVQDIKKKMLAKALYVRFNTKITRFFVFICSLLLFVNILYFMNSDNKQFFVSPIDQSLSYDALIDPAKTIKKGDWLGYYSKLEKWSNGTQDFSSPKFEKIIQGEIWRIFTPCLLHSGLIHLFFNMIWFWALGKQIEERILSFRYLLLVIILGCLTNTIQYLASGPNFIGFSGVVCGLGGFVWMRQKVAPWEGYPIPKSSLNFLFIFIFGIALVQVGTFLLQYLGFINLTLNIANSAHISGLFFGALFARLHYFDRQKK